MAGSSAVSNDRDTARAERMARLDRDLRRLSVLQRRAVAQRLRHRPPRLRPDPGSD